MQPTTREMQAMAAAGQISLDDLRAAGGVHDDFLDQMLGGLQPSAWPPELASAAGAKAPGGGAEAEGMHQHHQHQQQQFGGGLYDESALLASRLRQHQISGGGAESAEAATKQMVLQQLADLRHGHHMLLQGMGRSTGGGAGRGDGGMLLPLSLGSGGSGGDVQALLKAAANSTVLIHRSPQIHLLPFFRPVKNLESFAKSLHFYSVLVPGRRGRHRLRRRLRRIAPAAAAATFPAASTGLQAQRATCVHGLMLEATHGHLLDLTVL